MGKFKVGDKVRVVCSEDTLRESNITREVLSGGVYTVKHSCHGSVQLDCELDNSWISPFWLELVNVEKFTKSDLKDGMRVEHKNGEIGYVGGDKVFFDDGDYNGIDRYTDGLLDIYGCGEISAFAIIRITDRDGTVLFEREPEKVKLELEVTPEQAEAIRKQLG